MAEKKTTPRSKHIKLTSHPGQDGGPPVRVVWGAPDAKSRGPIIATLSHPEHRNAIGTHSGAYAVYRALAIAAGSLKADHHADLTNTSPTNPLGPHPQWSQPDKIVSIDPWGASVQVVFSDWLKKRPSSRRCNGCLRVMVVSLRQAVRKGRPD